MEVDWADDLASEAGQLDICLAARAGKRQRLAVNGTAKPVGSVGDAAPWQRPPGQRKTTPTPPMHLPGKGAGPQDHPAHCLWPKLTQHLFDHRARDHAESMVCPRCVFVRRAPAWVKVARISLACGGRTWLMAKSPTASAWGWGCKVCRLLAQASAQEGSPVDREEVGSAWARLAVASGSGKGNILRHAASATHQKAIQAYLHKLGLSAQDESLQAPPPAEFKRVLLQSRSGVGNQASIQAPDGRKEATMSWCLFEALRGIEREVLRRAEAITINQDGRHAVLQTRYIVCTNDLEVRCGLLTLTKGHDTRASGLAIALLDAIDKFATPRLPHNRTNTFKVARPPPVPDQRLIDTIRRAIFAFNADKASDEQLTGRLLQPGSGRAPLESEVRLHLRKLPNLRFVLFDKAHAAQRIQKRTWQKDPMLEKWTKLVLLGPQAIVHQLDCSHALKARFKHHVESLGERFPTNIGWRAHRFDSVRRPLARLVLNFPALLNLADEVVRLQGALRCSNDAFSTFLQEIDDEGAVLLGMLADASDECMLLTRFLDHENFDAANVASQITRFRGNIRSLFQNGLCLTTGFTQHMLKFLEQPRLIIFRGEPRTLGMRGGAPQEVIKTCLARMQNWVKTAEAVLEAEFPKFDELMGFTCFRLATPGGVRPSDRDQAGGPGPEDQRCVQMLARVAGVAVEKLAAQLTDHRAIAQQALSQDGGSFRSAWQQAYRTTQQDSKRQKRFPVDALRPALIHYLAWPGSTSRVEQDFARLKRLQGEQHHPGNDRLLRWGALATTAGQTPLEDDQLIARARIIWAENFRPPRRREDQTTLKPRKQCPSPTKTAKGSGEAGWLRQRRQAVAKQQLSPQSQRPAVATMAERLAPALWTEAQEKEVTFNHQKQEADRNERHLMQKLLPEDEPTAGAHQRFKTALQKRQQQYLAAQRRLIGVTALPQVPLLPGTRIYVEKGAINHFKEPAALHAALQARKLRQVDMPHDADACVVPDPVAPPPALLWRAVLQGGLLCSPEFMQGFPGPVIKYKRAFDYTRIIWISPGWRATYSRMLSAWRRMLANSGRPQRWRFTACWDDWHTLLVKKTLVQHEAEVVALVLPSERNATRHVELGLNLHQFEEYKQTKARHKLTTTEFLQSLKHMDRGGCSQGISSR